MSLIEIYVLSSFSSCYWELIETDSFTFSHIWLMYLGKVIEIVQKSASNFKYVCSYCSIFIQLIVSISLYVVNNYSSQWRFHFVNNSLFSPLLIVFVFKLVKFYCSLPSKVFLIVARLLQSILKTATRIVSMRGLSKSWKCAHYTYYLRSIVHIVQFL